MAPDFQRDVRFIMGLPFDALTLIQTESRLRASIAQRARCFMSTPNLNFTITCLKDVEFRLSVLQSDLSVADGWPLVSIGRLIGGALPERVSGSTLFERLMASPIRPPIAVYFFGGSEAAGRATSELLHEGSEGGVVCMGYTAPGFGGVAEMSTPSQIDAINRAGADFVVVAVGAKKGQAWIQRNRTAIAAPVVSYLGAVVNFVAGTVARAPEWVQACGLEWLWRIKEEPALWRRYASDGAQLLRLLTTRALPLALARGLRPVSTPALKAARLSRVEGATSSILKLTGVWACANSSALRQALQEQAESRSAVVIDLSALTHLDSTVLALLSLLYGWQAQIGKGWEVVGPSNTIRRNMRLAGAEYLLPTRGER